MQQANGQTRAWKLALVPVIVALLSEPASATACTSFGEQKNLLLGETVGLQEKGELQVSVAASSDGDGANEYELEADYGMDNRTQVSAGVRQDRGRLSGAGGTLDAAVGIGLLCNQDAPAMRLDLGIAHDRRSTETEQYARLIAGGPFMFGSWHAGATHGTSDALRSYFGAAVLHTEFTPLAIEARRESDGAIWKTLLSAGLYLYSSDTIELALGLAQPGDSGDQRRRLMLKLTGEF